MADKKWKIDIVDGGKDKTDLIDCKIEQTDTGYNLVAPGNNVLASTGKAGLPFSFTNVAYEGWIWTITVTTLNTRASGTWTNNDPDITAEEGSWSAGAGTDPKLKKSKTPPKTKAAGKTR